jgi:hypothetical protein
MNQVYVGGAPAPQRSSGCGWVVAILVGGMVLLLLAMAALATFGWSLFAKDAQAALQADPAIVEHIGTIRDMSVDITATGEASGSNEFVWDLEGDKGKGRVLAQLVTGDDGERLESGTLTLPDGREFPLGGGSPPADAPAAVEPSEGAPMDVEPAAPADAAPGAEGGDAPAGNRKSESAEKVPRDDSF